MDREKVQKWKILATAGQIRSTSSCLERIPINVNKHFEARAFIKPSKLSWLEFLPTNLKVVGSSPTGARIFNFVFFAYFVLLACQLSPYKCNQA